MCDDYYNYNCWQNTFYHQYMQQHAAMMHWIQNLHSNVNFQGVQDANHICECCTQCPTNVHYNYKPREYISSNKCGSLSENSSASSSHTYSNPDLGIKEPEGAETCEDDESDYEFELNVDAILAMRRAKEELKKGESSDGSSIVMIDKEDIELVDLGSLQDIESKRSILIGGVRDRNSELQYEKEFKKNLYGEKFRTIAGLETAMSLTYERLCDNHQPSVWPVYPLRLTSSAK